MAGSRGPTVRRRRLGAELRRLREDKELTGEDVGRLCGMSPAKISRIETNKVKLTKNDLEMLLEAYAVTEDRRLWFRQLARAANLRGWWETYGTLPVEYANYIALEAEAVGIKHYGQALIHGLLQTEGYARAAIQAPLMALATSSEVNKRVQIRMTRQKLLERAVRVWMVLDEAALYREVGGREVMYQQLGHLVEVASLPNVTIQILPNTTGSHPGVVGSFMILEFPEVFDPDVVCVETLTTSFWVEDDMEVRMHTLCFDQLGAAALAPNESIELIARVAGKHYGREAKDV